MPFYVPLKAAEGGAQLVRNVPNEFNLLGFTCFQRCRHSVERLREIPDLTRSLSIEPFAIMPRRNAAASPLHSPKRARYLGGYEQRHCCSEHHRNQASPHQRLGERSPERRIEIGEHRLHVDVHHHRHGPHVPLKEDRGERLSRYQNCEATNEDDQEVADNQSPE
jgi:hypothetical protein